MSELSEKVLGFSTEAPLPSAGEATRWAVKLAAEVEELERRLAQARVEADALRRATVTRAADFLTALTPSEQEALTEELLAREVPWGKAKGGARGEPLAVTASCTRVAPDPAARTFSPAAARRAAARAARSARGWSGDEHARLHSILPILASDYADYGGAIIRWEDPQQAYPDCSAGCRFARWLEGDLGADWCVCTNPMSHRCGLLTFEHQGCQRFEPEEEDHG